MNCWLRLLKKNSMLCCKWHVVVGVTSTSLEAVIISCWGNEKPTVKEKPHMAQTGNQSYSPHLSYRKYQNVLLFCLFLSVPPVTSRQGTIRAWRSERISTGNLEENC